MRAKLFSPRKTSTVCMIAKDEELYLKEWVYYYFLLGFDEIIIYDNESADNSAAILKNLQSHNELRKKLKVRYWSKGKDTSPQITAYRDAIKKCRNEWILFVDADEFLVLHKDENVNEFLARFSDNIISAVGINWRIFGDSHLEANDGRLLTERFTKCSEPEFDVNHHIKTFARVKMINGDIHMHACETTGKFIMPDGTPLEMRESWGVSKKIDIKIAQINHYYCKTKEEFLKKIIRGQAGCADDHPLKYYYDWGAFDGHNRNENEDLSAQKNLEKLKIYTGS